ncbi:MAG: hypothetical protein P0S95_05575 [Rhabdochlamydiaceae bacterium]|nr:hypothetical protein [Candidatus Amphrikana amoebophyrae]
MSIFLPAIQPAAVYYPKLATEVCTLTTQLDIGSANQIAHIWNTFRFQSYYPRELHRHDMKPGKRFANYSHLEKTVIFIHQNLMIVLLEMKTGGFKRIWISLVVEEHFRPPPGFSPVTLRIMALKEAKNISPQDIGSLHHEEAISRLFNSVHIARPASFALFTRYQDPNSFAYLQIAYKADLKSYLVFLKAKPSLSSQDIRNILTMCIHISQGLELMHFYNVIHCDLSPGNIFIEDLGEKVKAVIADLGGARYACCIDEHIRFRTYIFDALKKQRAVDPVLQAIVAQKKRNNESLLVDPFLYVRQSQNRPNPKSLYLLALFWNKILGGEPFDKGTPNFCAPEVEESYLWSKAADVYSFGRIISTIFVSLPHLRLCFAQLGLEREIPQLIGMMTRQIPSERPTISETTFTLINLANKIARVAPRLNISHRI